MFAKGVAVRRHPHRCAFRGKGHAKTQNEGREMNLALLTFMGALLYWGDGAESRPATFVRRAAHGVVKECVISIRAKPTGWTVTSETYRGEAQLSLTSRYDDQDRLTGAAVTLTRGSEQASAVVEMDGAKARVVRSGQPPQEFELPPGVIVTSAPDWTDIWMLCRRYDRAAGGQQSLTGLWIHPTQAAQLITFRIERTGADTIEHEGRKLSLDRFTIRIRGPAPYAAWADDQGRLVKLSPLPVQDGSGIVSEPYAGSAQRLGLGLK
jgi:hypothetical protein